MISLADELVRRGRRVDDSLDEPRRTTSTVQLACASTTGATTGDGEPRHAGPGVWDDLVGQEPTVAVAARGAAAAAEPVLPRRRPGQPA